MKTRENIERSQSEVHLSQNSEVHRDSATLYMLNAITFHQDAPLYEKIHYEALAKLNDACDKT